MRLSRRAALGLLVVMIAGTFLPELRLAPGVSVDPGGALIPAGVALYLLLTADRRHERRRALVAALWTAAAVYASDWFLPSDPGGGRGLVLDPLWSPVLVAAAFGYLAGRSRRAAFIAATLGVILVDLISAVTNGLRGIPGAWVDIGGAGALDAVVLAGVGAVALAEIFGETREWLARRRALQRARRGPGAEEPAAGGPEGAAPGGVQRGPGRERPSEGAAVGDLSEGPAAPSVAASWILAALAVAVVAVTAWLGPRFQRPTGDEVFDAHMQLREIGTDRLLLVSARVMEAGDIWIDAHDTWYRILRVDGTTAYARSLMPPAAGTLAGSGAGAPARPVSDRDVRPRAPGDPAVPATPAVSRPPGEAGWSPVPGGGPDRALAAWLRSAWREARPGIFSAWRPARPGLIAEPGAGPEPGPAALAAALPLGALFQKVVDPAPVRPTPRGEGFVGIYHTHNDESYIPSDGTASVNGRGGIHQVGDALGEQLARHGFRVVKSEALHLPHDRGAYRRSRRTAMKMLPKNPLVLLDVHRDATPPEFYREVVKGQPVTQVRLVVGRENPFRRTNLAFARRLKAEADRAYPGLVKGIYYGRGDYNQDLGPRTLLIEVGAHTNSRLLAERGAALFASVLDRVLAEAR